MRPDGEGVMTDYRLNVPRHSFDDVLKHLGIERSLFFSIEDLRALEEEDVD